MSEKIQKELSQLWSEEILPNWLEYREFLLEKERREKYFIKTSKDLSTEELNLKINKDQVIHLWTLGLPQSIRNILWKVVIGNNLDLGPNSFEYYLEKPSRNPQIIENIKEYVERIYNKDKDSSSFKTDMRNILTAFYSYRPDLPFSKKIVFLLSEFYSVFQDCAESFSVFTNFFINSYLIRFINKDEYYMINFLSLFKQIFQDKLPGLFKHFYDVDIKIEWEHRKKLFFMKWAKYLFSKTFKMGIVLRIFDCFILKGEMFVFDVSIAILRVFEKELRMKTKKEIEKFLCSPIIIEEKKLFDEIESCGCSKSYYEYFEDFEVGYEKSKLFENM